MMSSQGLTIFNAGQNGSKYAVACFLTNFD
jgi:hypothetical protein